MQVYEQSPDKTPHLFYMGREVIDAEGNPLIIYDVPVRQDIGVDGIRYTRKSAMGVRQTWLTPYSAVLLNGFDEASLAPVMTQHVIQEVSDDGGLTWYVPEVTERTIDADGDGLIDYLLTVGASSYCRISTVDNYFLEKCGKQEYEISAPGKLTRLYLEVTLHDVDQAIVDISDFDGSVIHNTVDNVITYLFYPDGIEYAVIDPYLTVTALSTTINIKTTAAPYFEIEFDQAKGGTTDIWYSGSGSTTNLCYANGLLALWINYGTLYKQLDSTTTTTLTLLESSNSRVRLRASGLIANVTGYSFVQDVTVLPSGHIFYHTTFTNNTGGMLTGIVTFLAGTNSATYTNETRFSDSEDTSPTYNTEWWYGMYTPDGMPTLVAGVMAASEKAQQSIRSFATNACGYATASHSLVNGESWWSCIVQSITGYADTQAEVDAELGQYNTTEAVFPTIVDTTGSFSVPTALQISGVDEFGTDGAYHLDGSV